jgi:hypothetical protein
MVRRILDTFEEVAPWDRLYYAPSDAREFLAMEVRFHGAIEGIPGQVDSLLATFPEGSLDASQGEMLDDARFFFSTIHESVSHDLGKLRSKLKALSLTAETIALTEDEREFVSELTADLKGKYTSSMMGAAANLIAGEQLNGVEIEPILFPEKQEEFERNELLVETLTEVVENISNLLEEVPLAHAVEQWKLGERVDQYALTSLYSFLGNIGKLMKDKCRRALYSGDYHQIRRRETLLSARINELQMLHNISWGTAASGSMGEGETPFPMMIQKATELASILDINILRKIIGEKLVKDLLTIVTIEKEKSKRRDGNEEDPAQSGFRKDLPKNLYSLIDLVRDDDLNNFLNLLLGSVLKRGSLTLKRNQERKKAREQLEEIFEGPAVEGGGELFEFDEEVAFGGAASEVSSLPKSEPSILQEVPNFGTADQGSQDFEPEVDFSALEIPPVDFDPVTEDVTEPTADPAAEALVAAAAREKLEALQALQEIMLPLLSRSNAHRKSFELVHRMLKQNKTLPPAMLQSMHPYLFDLMNMLIPQLHNLPGIEEVSADHSSHLIEFCTFLCKKELSPAQLRSVVPGAMQRLIRLLDGLSSTTSSLILELEEQVSNLA